MATNPPTQFDQVSVVCKANVYFDGKVVSHTVRFADGRRKTLGLIYPGSYRFDTASAEQMDIIAGACRVKLPTEAQWQRYPEGTSFRVPAESSFEIAVDSGVAEYICSYE